MQEIKQIYGSEIIKCSVIGSKLAEKSHKNHSEQKIGSKNKSISRSLIFLGLFNKSDEFSEVLKIHDFISNYQLSYFNKIVYRPHPLSNSNQKQIDLELALKLGIEINRSTNLNLIEFDGVICLPSSVIFDVLLSGVPAVLYAPKYIKYRTSPHNLINFKHFQVIRDLKPLPIITNFKELQTRLSQPLPNQNKINTDTLQKIFPKFSTSYESRISSIIENL
jgi:hypothetical protein